MAFNKIQRRDLDTTINELLDRAGTGSGGGSNVDLSSHTSNKSNPHGVTKTQVGLGNVPNVATNDQTPTYTTAYSASALKSGEKLSVAFGKIAKAVSDSISHISNKNNPHGVTATQVGAVPYVYASTSNYDMDTILKTNHIGFYYTTGSTKGTPYAKGNSSCQIASIYSCSNSADGFQIAFLSASEIPMTRCLRNGVISDWVSGMSAFDGVHEGEYIAVDNTISSIAHFVAHALGSNRIGMFEQFGESEITTLVNFADLNNMVRLSLYPESTPNEYLFMMEKYLDGVCSTFRIYGDHTHPSGYYTGNGNATRREIAVTILPEGVDEKYSSQFLLVGTDYGPFAIVHPFGAVIFDTNTKADGGSTTYLNWNDIYYMMGVLYIQSTNTNINKSGSIYYYRPLV